MMKLNELYKKVDEMNKRYEVCRITVPHDLIGNCCMFVIERKDNEWITTYWDGVEAGRNSCVTTGIKEKDKYADDTAEKLEKMLQYVENHIDKFDIYAYSSFQNTLNKRVNWWIKKARESAGITQQDLVNKSGISIATIKRIELSDSEPSQEQIYKIAKALDTEVTDISQKFCTDAAIKAAKEIKLVADKTKLQAQKIKLSNCLVSKEFDEIINTVLLLSATYDVNTQFLFPIIEDVKNECEHTKTVVYTFINAL